MQFAFLNQKQVSNHTSTLVKARVQETSKFHGMARVDQRLVFQGFNIGYHIFDHLIVQRA